MSRRKQPRDLAPGARFSDGREVLKVLRVALRAEPEKVQVLNHHGYYSLFVQSKGHRFKIAECESVERAMLAETAINAVRAAGGPIPNLHLRDGAVLVADWGEGVPCKNESVGRQRDVLLACQYALQKVPIPDVEPRFLQMETLIRRFREKGPSIINAERIEAMVAHLWEQLPSPDAPRVLHPDLTPANIVLGVDGPLIIDNEAMAVGCGHEFDVWNSGEALCGHRKHACIQSYVADFNTQCPSERLLSHQEVWNAFRTLRRMLKAIEKGRLIKARWLLRRLSLLERL